MKQADLNRAVARATGETVETIKRLGFLLASPEETLDPDSPDLGPRVLDWDALEIERRQADPGRPPCDPVTA